MLRKLYVCTLYMLVSNKTCIFGDKMYKKGEYSYEELHNFQCPLFKEKERLRKE